MRNLVWYESIAIIAALPKGNTIESFKHNKLK